MLGIHVADDTEQWSCHQLSLNHSILFDKCVTDLFQMLPVPRWVCCFWKENNKLQEELCAWTCVCMCVCVCVCVCLCACLYIYLSRGWGAWHWPPKPFLVPRVEESIGLYIYTPICACVCYAQMIIIICWFHIHLQLAAALLKQYKSNNK